MHATAVKPPAAAARVPVAIVSLYSWPGSRRWTWMSMNPGAITRPPTSTVSTPGDAGSPGPTRTTRPACMSTSPGASSPLAGSTTRPFRIRRSIVLDLRALDADQEVEDRHPHRDAVGHLIDDHRVWPIGHLGRHLDTAVDGPGMHDQHVVSRAAQLVQREPVEPRVLAERRD